ncbi:MAG: HlyD family type I secretion periplasmic adaptor subunit [Thauera sp.]|nr:HlyD family type I secretion periplasmic adaptor subunit [Thauera sp.]
MSHKGSIDYRALVRESRGQVFRPGPSLLFLVILGFFIAIVVWAAIAELDEVVRGEGRIIPPRKLQSVQSYDGGIISKVHVRRGDRVEEGALLVELDITRTRSEYNQALQQHHALSAEIARLSAEVRGEPFTPDTALREAAPAVVLTQSRLHEARRQELHAELQVVEQQTTQRKAELAEMRSTIRNTAASIALSQRELALIEPLVRRGIEPELELLRLQRGHQELTAQKQAAELAVVRLEAAIAEARDRRQAVIERFRSEAFKELSAATARLAELEQALPAREDRVTRSEIRSPVQGVVNQVLVTTEGAVAQPGATLVEIVPADDTLLVEALIRPEDIAFIRAGQGAKVKVTAYDFARYGSMEGEVVTVGADTVEQPKTGLRLYPVEVRTTSELETKAGKPLEISTGMVAEVDILTGRRTILEYLLQPVARMQHRAFTER